MDNEGIILVREDRLFVKYKSVFDIMGPIMIGPSSSHTAGAARIGLFARRLFAKSPTEVIITLYGSFAKTYKGHGTDVALIGGLMNFSTNDKRIPQAKHYADEHGIKIIFIESDEEPVHPNTVKLQLSDGIEDLDVVGVSIGGGKIRITGINSFLLTVPDTKPSLFIVHEECQNVIEDIQHVLNKSGHQISDIQMSQKENESLMGTLIKLEHPLTQQIIDHIEKLPHIKVTKFISEGDSHVL